MPFRRKKDEPAAQDSGKSDAGHHKHTDKHHAKDKHHSKADEKSGSDKAKPAPPPLPPRPTESDLKAAGPSTPRGRADSGVSLFASLPAPPLDFRWVHTGSKLLDLPTVPISGADPAYKPFSADENARIEEKWQSLSPERRAQIEAAWGREDGEWGQKITKKKAEKKDKDKDGKKRLSAKDPFSRPITPGGDVASPSMSAPHSDTEDPPEQLEKSELYKSIIEQAQSDPERLDVVKGVPVAQDSLFEVDLETLSLHPVFWPQSGPRVPVIRGTWFMIDETKPCTWDLAAEIEKAYQEIKPWLPSYQHELEQALIIGPSGEEKLKYNLPAKFGTGLGVVFEDESRCRIIASGAFDYLSRYVWSSLGTKPGGTFLYRGFTAAATAKEVEKAKKDKTKKDKDEEAAKRKSADGKKPAAESSASASDSGSGSGKALSKKEEAAIMKDKEPPTARDQLPESLQDIVNKVKTEFDTKKKALEEANAPVIHARNDDQPCTDLILVIHGIGQNLATQYESFSFIYASNQLRQVLRKQSLDPALSSIMRDRRFQILPVQWRANLKLESETSGENAQNERDNVFTIADITIGKSIPYIRELTNSVLLDIPLFMSDHKTKMIEAVCEQANRLYRMWVARHPEFEKNGRVHIIGHSLGSALAAEILSHQPTTVPALSDLPKMVVQETKNRFLFNTRNLFLAGSPLGVFLQLQQAHIIARAGRERTMHPQPDEAYNHSGRFGCMAIDNLYNIFYTTDPVAYAINPAVDVATAKERPPIDIPSVTPSMFPSLPSMPSMPTFPNMPTMPTMPKMPNVSRYLPSYFSATGNMKAVSPKKEKTAAEANQKGGASDVEIELTGGEMCLVGTRGERRFAALNPRGALDFALPSGGVNDYLDMITAHGNYWNDNNFGAFILNETFSSLVDDQRTGLAGEGVGSFPGSWVDEHTADEYNSYCRD